MARRRRTVQLDESGRYNVAREEILAHLEKPPFHLGGTRPSRDDLHDRERVRMLGGYAGQIWIADDFDAPLDLETFEDEG